MTSSRSSIVRRLPVSARTPGRATNWPRPPSGLEVDVAAVVRAPPSCGRAGRRPWRTRGARPRRSPRAARGAPSSAASCRPASRGAGSRRGSRARAAGGRGAPCRRARRCSGVAFASAGCAEAHSSSAAAELVERLVVDLEEPRLLEVGRRHAPAALEVAVEAVAEDVAQRARRSAPARRTSPPGRSRSRRSSRPSASADPAGELVVAEAGGAGAHGRPVERGAQEPDLDRVVEVARLERGVLAVVGEREELAGAAARGSRRGGASGPR